jgi:hypothetical protein
VTKRLVHDEEGIPFSIPEGRPLGRRTPKGKINPFLGFSGDHVSFSGALDLQLSLSGRQWACTGFWRIGFGSITRKKMKKIKRKRRKYYWEGKGRNTPMDDDTPARISVFSPPFFFGGCA